MNEYTRREEVRATFIASAILVLCIAVAVLRLVTVEGRLVPDPGARRQAEEAEARVAPARACALAGEKLIVEIDLFKAAAKSARMPDPGAAPPAPPPPATSTKGRPPRNAPPPPKPKEPDKQGAWASAQPLYKQVKTLAGCREATEALLGARVNAIPAWEAIAKAAAITPPGAAEAEQFEAAKQLLSLVADIQADKVAQATKDAEAAFKANAERDRDRALTAMVREPLPQGVFSRRVAVSVGVGLTVCALFISYLGVRAASMRRLATLLPLRDAVRSGRPGMQAAEILKTAAAHNSGEPGLVIGAAIGGFSAALLAPRDADLFVAGVMAGLLIGLGAQWAFRLALGAGRWRARTTELAEVEKPAIPIVLVLSGVKPGLELEFIQFLRSLPPADAAAAVEKLASQAEERILAAADAGAALTHGKPPPG
ncbi:MULTISPECIES: hypothetical protein [Sorangium]|uniref:Alanine/arginine/proline-rich membrane protein n=1 Tax=Sorangium cellulosum (strain So ce56) TaxID=448385 RepID=A9FUY8_SORC5|nr:hypothetical protein [Sorangium cellulosum]CAN92218.1 putative alanine/arginine/proline-rich membrane protein [Sorangium cellulosum So ce56]